MATAFFAHPEERRVDRDEVFHRARCTGADDRVLPLVIVNISPHGMMARCDHDITTGEQIRTPLPGVGTIAAEIRWALGGRIGCQFTRPIPLAAYYGLLSALLKP